MRGREARDWTDCWSAGTRQTSHESLRAGAAAARRRDIGREGEAGREGNERRWPLGGSPARRLTPGGTRAGEWPETRDEGSVQFLQNFKKITRFPVTLNLWTYVWSIKYR
jgi:hypothetical protein